MTTIDTVICSCFAANVGTLWLDSNSIREEESAFQLLKFVTATAVTVLRLPVSLSHSLNERTHRLKLQLEASASTFTSH